MIFKGLSENAGWTVAAYHTIWRYGYDFMLDMAQIMINEDLDNSQVFTADVGSAYVEKTQEIASCGNVIRNCSATRCITNQQNTPLTCVKIIS